MFFSCFLGEEKNFTEWQSALASHARWLGLSVHVDSHTADTTLFAAAWLVPGTNLSFQPVRKSPERWCASTNTHLDEKTLAQAVQRTDTLAPLEYPNDPLIEYYLLDGSLRVTVPPTAPEQFYYVQDQRGMVLANDLRLLRRWLPARLNATAVYALLQFRAIPPPLSLYDGIGRIPNGHQFRCRAGQEGITFVPFFFPARAEGRQEMRDISEEAAIQRFQETLDENLLALPESAILFFSGGVDSSLLAARLAVLGRKRTQLINFSFGPEDAEGKLALEMAALLKMPCEQLVYDEKAFPEMLARIGKEFSFPFGDSSAIPVNLMIHSTLSRLGAIRTVIEGVGPDQTFGAKLQDKKWRRAESTPAVARAAAAGLYRGLKLWEKESKLGTVSNILRKRWQMKRNSAQLMAINSLDGIAYTIPRQERSRLTACIGEYIEALGAGLDPNDQSCLVNLLHFAIGTVCGKSTDLYRLLDLQAINPYMSPEMIRLSFMLPHRVRSAGGQAKSLLKKLVVRDVPADMIYRPKKGFDPPIARMMGQPAMLDCLQRQVLSDANPLLEYIHQPVLQRMIRRIKEGGRLSYDTYRFIWMVLFTTLWLDQQD
jgi:asparagine synthase (glutamine-hydrolysing)